MGRLIGAWLVLTISLVVSTPAAGRTTPGAAQRASTSREVSGSHREVREVKLRGVSLPAVEDKLVELLERRRGFELKAHRITLTTEEALVFFPFVVEATQGRRGAEVELHGLVDGRPFKMKVERGSAKMTGLRLTAEQFDGLVTFLPKVVGPGRQVKVQAIVDGRKVEVKVEGEKRTARTKIEPKGGKKYLARDGAGVKGAEKLAVEKKAAERGNKLERREKAAKPEPVRIEKAEKPVRIEKTERLVRIEKVEKPARIEKAEKPVRIGKVEKPEQVANRH